MSNIITDPHLQTLGQAGSLWSLQCHEGVEAIPERTSDGLALHFSKTRGANWQGALQYAPFAVAAGESLALSFSARAEHPFTFSVWLGQHDAPYQSLVPEANHFGEATLSTQWQTFTHHWQPSLSEPAARLNFVLGQIDTRVEIKAITLTRASERNATA